MAQCISQIRMKAAEGGFNDVPCGRCGFCLQNRRKEWSFRLQKEVRYHESAIFTTLTISDENLVYGDDDNGVSYPILDKRSLQLFMKRLRHKQAKLSENKIKYYAVGEYGTKTNRPHYHALVFGLDRRLNEEIDDIWREGLSHVGTVTNDSIDYITKYVVNRYDHSHYLVPPFACISNGIGLQHFLDNQERYQDETMVKNSRGYNQKLPRYYRNKLEREEGVQERISEKMVDGFEARRAEEVRKLSKSHEDAEAYIEERSLANHKRILRVVKEGGKF